MCFILYPVNGTMRVRSFPFTSTFIVFLVICWFPLLEFDINWNYQDWDQTVSNRTGTNILDATTKLGFQRVPGISPGWDRAHRTVKYLLRSINNKVLSEYNYTWKYVKVNRVSAIHQEFHVNANIGGYIATLSPKTVNLTEDYKSVCIISNMDSVYGSDGFSANALGVTQIILALEELAAKPGLVNPITAIISDTRENGSNVLMNLFSLPELQRCMYSMILDSQGIAQTVPEVIYLKSLRSRSQKLIPATAFHYRVSNYVLDGAGALALLTNSEVSLIQHSFPDSCLIKLSYVDSPFHFHTPGDQKYSAKAAAAKARYDTIIQLASILGRAPADSLRASWYGDFSSYISVFGYTVRVSAISQLLMIIIGIVLSILFLTIGNMGQIPAIQSGCHHSRVIVMLQLVVYCITMVIILLWLSFEPLAIHKLSAYLLATILCMILSSLILLTLQINFYSQYFVRDYAGAAISTCSIIYGVIGSVLLLCGQHITLNFVIPCFCFGLTNIPLFLRRIHLGDQYKWKKALYACCLVGCGIICYLVNMGSACATLHAIYWGINTEDLTVCVVVVLSFWEAVFPLLFCISCLKVIYMVDEQVEQKPSVLSVSTLDDLLEEIRPSEDLEGKREKIIFRRFMNEVSGITILLVIFVMISSHHLPAWNSDKPVRVFAGVAYLDNEFELERNKWIEGHLVIGGHSKAQQQVEKVLRSAQLLNNYTVSSITHSSCYLYGHVKGPCLKVGLTKDGSPVVFNITEESFNATHLDEVKSPFPLATNVTEVTKQFIITIPQRNHTSVYGYSNVLFRVYTTNLADLDSKVYSNPVEVTVEYGETKEIQKGYVIRGMVMADLKSEMQIGLTVRSRTGSQVIIRITDVGHCEPEALYVLGKGLGYGFVFGGMTGLSFLSRTVNYFITFPFNVCKKHNKTT